MVTKEGQSVAENRPFQEMRKARVLGCAFCQLLVLKEAPLSRSKCQKKEISVLECNAMSPLFLSPIMRFLIVSLELVPFSNINIIVIFSVPFLGAFLLKFTYKPLSGYLLPTFGVIKKY